MPKGQNTWPKDFQTAVGMRLNALVLAVKDIEKKSITKLLREIGIPSNRWGNYFNGDKPADAHDCVKFVERYGGTLEWIFRNDLRSIQDKDLRDKTWQQFQRLLTDNPSIHAA